MKGVNRMAAVVAIVAAGVLTIAHARSGDAMSSGLIGGSGAQQVGDFTWRGAVSSGEFIEIKGVNGDVIAERATGQDVEVRAEKSARRSDPGDVRIEVVEHSGGVTLCAVYPSSRGRENSCEPGSGGRNSVRNNDVQVIFHVKVPAGVGFRAAP